jgi:hypothetical protein
VRISAYAMRLSKAAEAVENYYDDSLQARRLIQSMTSLAGGHRSRALFKQCDEYAREVLGSIRYSYWLKAYTVFSGTFKEGWIPDNYYGKVIIPRLQGNYGLTSNYKALSSRLFRTELMPDLAYSVNGALYSPSMETLRRSELKKFLFATSEKIVYKLDSGLQGKSVTVYNRDTFPAESVPLSNGVFQRYICQHPFFDSFTNRSVSTIRITTVVDDKSNVSCRAAYLRLPREVDTHVKSATAIKIAVTIDGELQDKGYMPNWVPVTCHPDSEKAFAHLRVPNFESCVRTCVSLHRTMMFSRMIGWDVIVDIDGNVQLMEWNGHDNDIRFSEAASGPCFADLGWQNLWRVGTEISHS